MEGKYIDWDWKVFLLGFKRPVIGLLVALIAYGASQSGWSWVGGIAAERVWSTIEYYLTRYN